MRHVVHERTNAIDVDCRRFSIPLCSESKQALSREGPHLLNVAVVSALAEGVYSRVADPFFSFPRIVETAIQTGKRAQCPGSYLLERQDCRGVYRVRSDAAESSR